MDVSDDKRPIDMSQWHTMNLSQLEQQREIMQDRLNKLYDIGLNNPSISQLYNTIITNLDKLTFMIDHYNKRSSNV